MGALGAAGGGLNGARVEAGSKEAATGAGAALRGTAGTTVRGSAPAGSAAGAAAPTTVIAGPAAVASTIAAGGTAVGAAATGAGAAGAGAAGAGAAGDAGACDPMNTPSARQTAMPSTAAADHIRPTANTAGRDRSAGNATKPGKEAPGDGGTALVSSGTSTGRADSRARK